MNSNGKHFTNITTTPSKISLMGRVKRSLISCCSTVPDDTYRQEIDDTSFEPETTVSLPTSVIIASKDAPERVETSREFFGFDNTPITFQQLEKAYWWKKYYIAKSEKLEPEEKLEKLNRADTLYGELKEEFRTPYLRSTI